MRSNRKIVFVEVRSPRPHIFSRARLPRLGAVLLGTILRDAGWDVEVFIEDIEPVDWSVALEADVAAISTITSTATRAFELADRFRDAGIPVIMGGAHTSFLPEEALDHCDYIVRGEAETVIVPLVEAIRTGRDPGPLPGLSRLNKDGSYSHQPVAELLQNLESNPIPDFSLIRGRNVTKNVCSISTSRGCPYDCEFCSVIEMFGRCYRFKSVDRVIEEIRANAMDTNHIFICDDNFAAKRSRAKAIIRRMIDEGFNIHWSAQVRVEVANDSELLELMARSRCYGVYIGLESVNEKTLQAFNKRQTLKKITHAIERFHEYGIHIHGMFVIGSDEDDVETIKQTARYSHEMKIDSTQFLILTPLPGTRTFNQLEAQGRLLTREWHYYDGSHVVYEPRKMTAYELQREALKAHKDFYTIKSAARLALRGDYSYGAIRYYARRQTFKTIRAVKPYMENLRLRSAESVTLNPARMFDKKLKSIGIISNWMDDRSQTIITQFLNNLGISTVPAEKKDPDNGQAGTPLEKFMSLTLGSLREKVDCVLVPVNTTINERLAALNRKSSSIKQWVRQNIDLEGKLCLAPEIDTDEIYKACVQIGLALDIKINRIRRAYEKAIDRLENEITPKLLM